MNADEALDVAKVAVAAAVLAAGYCLPMIIALYRRHHRYKRIATLNLLLGWTVLGWLAALWWAAMTRRRMVHTSRGPLQLLRPQVDHDPRHEILERPSRRAGVGHDVMH